MERNAQAQKFTVGQTAGIEQPTGRYVYCVVRASDAVNFGPIGVDQRNVHSVVFNDLCALVHDCQAQPYESRNPEVAAARVLAHHQVVAVAWRRWGVVLPLTFNTITIAKQGDAEGNLVAWLKAEHDWLDAKLNALTGKAEYGLQVFWDPLLISKQVAGSSPGIARLAEGIRSKARGLEHMYRQQLERLLRKEIEAKAEEECKALYDLISRCVDNVKVERTKKGEPERQMLMNLSCLVSAAKYADLEAELEKVSKMDGFSVRLAGPLPPYSFC